MGCNERVLRKDVESHEEAAIKHHNRLLLKDNRSLRQDNLSFRQDNLSLQQKVAEQKEMMNNQLHQLVYKVELADLLRDGEVVKRSDDKMVGAYKSYMGVKKGNADNGDCCGVYLHLEDGPFPCRVSCTIEIVHWDGKPESARKYENTATYEEAEGWGWPMLIPLSKLTAAASPYVKEGHVTFIVTFRFLPTE